MGSRFLLFSIWFYDHTYLRGKTSVQGNMWWYKIIVQSSVYAHCGLILSNVYRRDLCILIFPYSKDIILTAL